MKKIMSNIVALSAMGVSCLSYGGIIFQDEHKELTVLSMPKMGTKTLDRCELIVGDPFLLDATVIFSKRMNGSTGLGFFVHGTESDVGLLRYDNKSKPSLFRTDVMQKQTWFKKDLYTLLSAKTVTVSVSDFETHITTTNVIDITQAKKAIKKFEDCLKYL